MDVFEIARLPRIHFGGGCLASLPTLISGFGRSALLVTGNHSLRAKPQWPGLVAALAAAGIDWQTARIGGEPTPQDVDAIVRRFHPGRIEVVVGIGGGSVIDAAKAIAGLLPSGDSILGYLEGVGDGRRYAGPALPMIAVPTTAGTGSEATRNAVIGERGPHGFKKSFRDERLVPEYALVDPDLLIGCPRPQLAANAMDALTQLIESRTSSRANPITSALARSGLAALGRALDTGLSTPPDTAQRHDLCHAALTSGICLAQTGLGAVHGLAAPLGAMFPLPHGIACGALLSATTAVNLRALAQREPGNPARRAYADCARWLGLAAATADDDAAREGLLAGLETWRRNLQIPRLGAYRIGAADFPRLVAAARGNSMKTNPLRLDDAELTEILILSS